MAATIWRPGSAWTRWGVDSALPGSRDGCNGWGPGRGSVGPKLARVWARGASKINLGPPTYFCNRWFQIWYTNWVWEAYQKATFKTKIGGDLGQGIMQKNSGPLLISTNVESSNFKFGIQLGFGTSLPKATFRTKIGRGLGQESIQKNWDPLFISATVEARDWEIGTQHEFRLTLPNTSFKGTLRRRLTYIFFSFNKKSNI